MLSCAARVAARSAGRHRAPALFCRPFARLPVRYAASQARSGESASSREEGRSPSVKHFAADTSRLLNILSRSLYSDRAVFLRELISNASDALQKRRLSELTGGSASTSTAETSEASDAVISVEADAAAGTVTISDTGIGMTKEEIVNNLGSIGKSGTAAFLERAEAEAEAGRSATHDALIGQFGVGFYSTLMVGERVDVHTRSRGDPTGWRWTWRGDDTYELAEDADAEPGTRVVVHLREDAREFADVTRLEETIVSLSNFVGAPIMLNGAQVNIVRPLWTRAERDISDEEHTEFYKFVSKSYDEPMLRWRYESDAPLQIRAQLYVGERNAERFGMGAQEPGIDLYSRRVLIQHRARGLLPEWLRFVKGVVDCEDVPLNIGREHLQDSGLMRRLGSILTKRVLRSLAECARRDRDLYLRFYAEFSTYLKEGICSGDESYKDELAALLRFESLRTPVGELVSLDEYIESMPAGQDVVYYLISPKRQFAEQSPYLEGFKRKGVNVLLLFTTYLDDFAMTRLGSYKGKAIRSVEAAHDVDALPDAAAAGGDGESHSDGNDGADGEADEQRTASDANALSVEQQTALCEWLKETLSLSDVRISSRLRETPALLVDDESVSFRRMMRVMDPERAPALPKPRLELNVTHPVVQKLAQVSTSNPEWARIIAEQLLDNCYIAAGLLDDPRSMLGRLNRIMDRALVFGAWNHGKSHTAEAEVIDVDKSKPAAGHK